MTSFSREYIDFCQVMVALKGDQIKEWTKSSNPLLAEVATEVLEIGKMPAQDEY